jgi:uncharacterized RDD family membrane protein YckC
MTNPAGGPPPPPSGPPPPPGGQPPPAPAGQGPMATPPGVTARPYAEWWKRVVAALIDGAILWIIQTIIGAIFGLDRSITVDPNTGAVSGNFLGAIIFGNVVLLLVGVAYYVALNGSDRGQTVGKMALRIAVRDDATGGPAGYGKAFIRYIVGAVLFILCIIPGVIDLLFPLWDPKKQTLHDKAANTVVVEVE